MANQCVKTKGNKIINICDFNIDVTFCVVAPDKTAFERHAFEIGYGFDCDKNELGSSTVLANKSMSGSFTAKEAATFACKRPSYSLAEYDRNKKVMIGRCSEY